MIRRILASTVARLDSNVYAGGGTDDTAALQAVLDRAKTEGGVVLVMDGAALVSGLTLYSGTTIECLGPDCGFFQTPQANRPIVTNADWDRERLLTRNVSLIGGTYNQDCLHQAHHVPETPEMVGANCYEGNHGVCGMEFCGVENLLVRDVRIVDFRTYAFMLTNFRCATIEDCWLDLPNRMHAQNQDGFHFWGPGQFLTIRNVGGKVGDDFMNIGPDEGDGVSSITDVFVDGVYHDDADQSIRILSRGTGLVDRVTIRNVIGTYRSFGFYIMGWYEDMNGGDFGDIFIENVALRHTAPNYDYRSPMLFNVGGNVRCLTLKNIRHEYPVDSRPVLELGLPFYTTTPVSIDGYVYPGRKPVIRNLILDGLTVLEGETSPDMSKIIVYGEVENLIVRNVVSLKDEDAPRSGCLIEVKKTGHVGRLLLKDVLSVGNAALVTGAERIGRRHGSDIVDE